MTWQLHSSQRVQTTIKTERERTEAFIRRCKRSELCSAKTKTFAEICEVYDDQLISNVIHNSCHILNQVLPSVSAAAENYNLRPRKHNRLLPEHAMHLSDAYRNFYCNILLIIALLQLYLQFHCLGCGLSTFCLINEYVYVCA